MVNASRLLFVLLFAGMTAAAQAAQMVAAANPLAARAGVDVLNAGGSAADAAVAVQTVLNLVEPQSSGIGGGAFIVYWDAAARRIITIDGRETAPASARPERFIGDDGKPRGFWDTVVGGQSVGVPGTLRAMELLHGSHGKRPWASLFERAIALSEDGFVVSPRLAASIAKARELDRFEATRRYFFDAAGKPLVAGARLTNPAFAHTLRRIAVGGADAFYEGEIAAAIVTAVGATSWSTNNITEGDLAGYEAVAREPVCPRYREKYLICGMGPPTSGGLTVGQILGLLQGFDLAALGPGADSAHLLAEAEKLAYADRAMYMADSDFEPVPVAGLLDAKYLAARARLIDRARAAPKAKAGVPPGAASLAYVPALNPGHVGTSHFVIRDREGNAASVTTTIEMAFGSRVMAAGFLLNNELTDFDSRPERNGRLVANRIEGGKRPRSSMSPTIVLADGAPHLLIGSPGGSRIIGYVASALIAILDHGMTPQQAVASGHVVHRNGKWLELEAGTEAAALRAALESRGHAVKERKLTSGLHAILIRRTNAGVELSGGADPRREGVVLTQ